jgi:SAM-dependent methyltransferase
MSREDVRRNLAGWEADADDYQARNASQLNRWDRLGWGTYDVPEDEIHALGEVRDLDVLELGCGAAQCGIRVARMGAGSVVGLDFSERQLAHARRNIAATESPMRLVRANAEELPFGDGSFDLVFCDHGATSFTDPRVTIPEAARVLRDGGLLAFNIASPFIEVFWGDDDAPPTDRLRRSYFGLGREEHPDGDGVSVQHNYPYGEWIRIIRGAGFVIEDLIELRPGEDATSTYADYAPYEWARDYPGENIWKARKA